MNNPPFHNNHHNPLPDANDIEQEVNDSLDSTVIQADDIQADTAQSSNMRVPQRSSTAIEQDKLRLRNLVLGLLLAGLVLGGFMLWGIATFLNRTGLSNPPSQQESKIEQTNVV